MKLFAVALLAATAVSPEMQYFSRERPVQNTPQRPMQTCLVLDAELFAHASPQFSDLRLYRDGKETPYVIHLSAPVQARETSIVPMNLGRRGSEVSFDAAMPEGSYSDLQLDVTAQDFIATVTVSGSQAQADSSRTTLGSYTIFDLSHQKLGRSTVLHIPTSDFRYLHFQIEGPLTPESITGLAVDKLPATEARYEMVAQSSSVTQKDHASVLEFNVPALVPVDRLAFTVGPQPVNFSRNVTINVTAMEPAPATDAVEPPWPRTMTGNLLRIHTVQNGHRIDEEDLDIDTPGTVLDKPAKWTVTIDNGDDTPLAIQSLRAQMLQRTLCFEAAGSGQYTLMYGDPALTAARYDYATLFAPQTDAAQALAGPEQRNPEYRPRPDQRPLTERYPGLLWGALLAVIATLAVIAFRSAKGTSQS
ncbi:MAG TPA: DUF3999 family protein [Acidobacteriaceae bacterium]|nr:DUF3999 family protein [Acidobacteriaceae bacterium]